MSFAMPASHFNLLGITISNSQSRRMSAPAMVLSPFGRVPLLLNEPWIFGFLNVFAVDCWSPFASARIEALVLDAPNYYMPVRPMVDFCFKDCSLFSIRGFMS